MRIIIKKVMIVVLKGNKKTYGFIKPAKLDQKLININFGPN